MTLRYPDSPEYLLVQFTTTHLEKALQIQLERVLKLNESLSLQIISQSDRFQDSLLEHLRDAWMKGHNNGFWYARNLPKNVRKADETMVGLEQGLKECPYIRNTKDLAKVALQYSVPLEPGDG